MHKLIQSLLDFHGEKAQQLSDIELTLKSGEAGDSGYRSKLRAQVRVFQNDRERAHHFNEELVLAELIKSHASVHGRIAGISEEHTAFGEIVEKLLSQIDDPQVEHSVVISDIRWFLSQYDGHATKEETILFPAVDRALSRGAWSRVAKLWITN